MDLQVRKFPSQSEDALPIVLLHGWGLGASVWLGCVEALRRKHPVYLVDMPGYLVGEQAPVRSGGSKTAVLNALQVADGGNYVDCFDIEAELQTWRCELPDAFVLVGFSLGGAIASALIETLFRGAIGLVTVSTNARFVAAEGWRDAVGESTFSKFLSDFDQDPIALMNRFCLLQSRGGRDEKKTRQWLRELQKADALSCDAVSLSWLRFGLEALLDLDLRARWSSHTLPVLHQFGAHDALVPLEAANEIARLSRGQIEIFSESGHLPFASERSAWVDSILDFIQGLLTTANTEQNHV